MAPASILKPRLELKGLENLFEYFFIRIFVLYLVISKNETDRLILANAAYNDK